MFHNTHFTIALHVLTALAHRQGETLTSAELAQSVGTNPAFLRGLLGRLKAADLIEVSLGKGGGARLRRAPAAISLEDVYDAVQEGPAMHKHTCTAEVCEVARGMGPVLARLEANLEGAVRTRLAGQTVADVLRQVRRGPRRP
ncbi:MAG: Rrf2 family transcriptional regulator [Myxococcales bacterium]|nr:Rrf2 family transcriptional regulator [Myxococcales bacterium]